MSVLLDTCTFVWLVSEPALLSARAAAAIDEAAEIYVSDVSVWEICLKWQVGKLGLPTPPRRWVEEQKRAWDLSSIAIDRRQMYRSTELPDHHSDPFDRLIVAQAIDASLTIATPDRHIERYPVAVLW